MTIRISRKKLRALAVDLGASSTLFALPDEGVILREASVAAADEQGRIVAAGNDALLHFKRAPEKRTILHPLRDGTVFDVSLCRKMLAGFVDRTFGKTARRLGLNAVLCIPASFGTAAFAAAEEAANGAGLRVIRVIQTPVAAALGAQLSIDQPEGHMVLDIGGSSTCAAVLTLGGIAMQRTAHTGGRHIDHAIMQYMQKRHCVRISLRAAEEAKFRLASALSEPKHRMQVHGCDVFTGFPHTVEVDVTDMYRFIFPHLREIAACAADVLNDTPPELAGDLLEHGVTLIGGSAQLFGLSAFLSGQLHIPVQHVRDPIACAALGACAAMEHPDRYFLTRKAYDNMAYL